MPTLIEWTSEGATWALNRYLRDEIIPDPGWQLLLWVNDLEPEWDTVLDDLQEADFGGYTRRDIMRETWQEPVVGEDSVSCTYGTTPLTWTSTGPTQTVYGYAVIDPGVPALRFMQRFAEPFVVVSGGILAVLPKFTHKTLCICETPTP